MKTTDIFQKIVDFVKLQYPNKGFISLHEPVFVGNERKYVMDAIDSTFVSSVGRYVDRFEEMAKEYTGAKHAIAVVNGTSALHMSLLLAGVKRDDYVLTQPLSFIATCNAISYVGAIPYFIDIDRQTLGLSAAKLEEFLKNKVELKADHCVLKENGKRISACVPMHTFGFPAEIDLIVELCNKYHIPVVEDAAESIGSTYKGKQTGTFGLLGVYSFNGNKTITSGGGGLIVTDNAEIAKLGKHLTTQAKISHQWEFKHDYIGYNYRMPNLNAAMICAQMEQLDSFIANKRELANIYQAFFEKIDVEFLKEPASSKANYWLNSLLFRDEADRDAFLAFTNQNGVMTRPVWALMNRLEMFRDAPKEDISNAEFIESRLANIPSGIRLTK